MSDAALALAAISLAASPAFASGPDSVVRRLSVMGTWFEIEVSAPNRAESLELAERAVRVIEEDERLLSTWTTDSPLASLNRAPVDSPQSVPPRLFDLLAETFSISDATNGAFDPAIAPLVAAWDLRGKGRIPGAPEIARAKIASSPGVFRLDVSRKAIARLDPLGAIDEGGWGKGAALDRAVEALRRGGATSAILDLGGQIAFLGAPPDGDVWTVRVADPDDRTRTVVEAGVTGGSISTSGNSERSRSVGGTRIGHLLDPRTGSPASDFGSVTVFAKSALVADALSTAFFVAGPEEGALLSERLRSLGYEHDVLFLVRRDGGIRARASRPLFDHLQRSDGGSVEPLDADMHDSRRRTTPCAE